MWAAILNQPELQGDKRLRRRMVEHRHLNFEAVYYDIQSSPELDSGQKTDFTRAVRRAYRQMDEILRESAGMKAASACRGFVRRFAGSRAKRTLGFVFTLNQDLLVERFYWNADVEKLIGLALHSPEWFKGYVGPLFGRSDDDELPLPSEERVTEERTNFWNKFGGQLAYVKLHGSFGWRSQDGSNMMVIGHEKLGSINREPVLKWYLPFSKIY
jgi:hypothetical protein